MRYKDEKKNDCGKFPDGWHKSSLANRILALQVFTTTLDGGITALLGIAKLHDTIALDGARAQLLIREVRLDTRMLGETGSHIPF